MAFHISLHYLSRMHIVVFIYECIYVGFVEGNQIIIKEFSLFIATLSHSNKNKKALIITNWKYILYNCAMQKHPPHMFYLFFFVSGEGSG